MIAFETIPFILSVFCIILFGYYMIPAGLSYLYFYVIRRDQWKPRHIQKRYPQTKSVLREIKWSFSTVLIITLITCIALFSIQEGKTQVYFSIVEYGWYYLFFSILLYIGLHDTYFYWIHRLLHFKPVFRWVHKTHHLSHTPTPFASLSYNPLEAFLQFGINLILIFIIPLHPVAIGILLTHNILLNTGGHTGFEVMPRCFFHHWFFKYSLTTTHHDMHHTKLNCNYGLYFNIWDRIMGTNHREYEKTFMEVSSEAPDPGKCLTYAGK